MVLIYYSRHLRTLFQKFTTRWLIASLMLSVFSAPTFAWVPPADVEGPIQSTVPPGDPARDYPFFATDLNLEGAGYIEEEFFLSGMANRYTTPTGETGEIIDGGYPYKTRVVVRRPVDANKFNGVVIVEWNNVTAGYDNEADWFLSGTHYVRSGYAYAVVSAQRVGVNSLRNWSPGRYGDLDVTVGGTLNDDSLSYDIYAQAVEAIRNPTGIAPLGDLKPELVIANGQSQSSGRLGNYVNSIHPLHGIIDALLLNAGGPRIRDDLDIPVFKVLTETDILGFINQYAVRQPDTDRMRTWEVAGASHSSWRLYLGFVSHLPAREFGPQPPDTACGLPSRSRVPDHHVLSAAVDHLAKWATEGVAPPTAPRIEVAGEPLEIVRDELGNAMGGIRLPQIDVPVAQELGSNTGPFFCALRGAHVPFSDETLAQLYPTHFDYVRKVLRSVTRNVRAGYLLPMDGKATISAAIASEVGRGLECGPLCQNVDAGLTSISKLRDQTDYFDFYIANPSDRLLVVYLERAQLEVARGDTFGQPRYYRNAIRWLERYVERLTDRRDSGDIQAFTANYLLEGANALIARIEAL